jgi:acetyl/propionyl-CoA carboxylase alpha subunit
MGSDANEPFVGMADVAVHVGPSSATESYLDMDKVIGAALSTGCDAVHPGYGFLSENAEFARACRQAGLIFIGPEAESILEIGDKVLLVVIS